MSKANGTTCSPVASQKCPTARRTRKPMPASNRYGSSDQAIPAASSAFFLNCNELAARLAPSDPQFGAEVAKIVSRHDTQILGPPPPRTQPA
jgi:hypothetical protein